MLVMFIERTERGLKLRTPAKLNLFLDVLGKRADGYHEIDTIMCPVSWCDQLDIEASREGIDFSIEGPGFGAEAADTHDPAWEIPADGSNLVVKALKAVSQTIGYSGGWRVRLEKRIPAAAGLGGGSSDAAAAIVAALAVLRCWDRDLATRIAQSLGSDIPLFLGGAATGIGLARATGRGEHVEILSGRPPMCFVISHPPVGSSTAEVYKLWQTDQPRRSQPGAAGRLLELCQDARHDWTSQVAAAAFEAELFNALETPASGLTEWIGRQLSYFQQLGKPRAMMSGSGSACFAIVNNLDEGRVIANKLIELGLPRAYVATAWYAAPIEQQLERIPG